jgi:hypothetical protein
MTALLHSDTRGEIKYSRVHNDVTVFMALPVGICMCISFIFLLPSDGTRVSRLDSVISCTEIYKLYSAYSLLNLEN